MRDNGGVTVISDPTYTTMTANARMLAMANTDDKASADQSIADAKATFGFTRPAAGEIDINCGHGQSHGSSDSGSSGCELVEIHVPAGSATQKLNLTKVLSGNGTMTLKLANATIGTLGANANGAACDIVATLPATLGGNISLVSNQAGQPTCTDDAPDRVRRRQGRLRVRPEHARSRAAFTDITAHDGGVGRGAASTGLASLKLTSISFAGIERQDLRSPPTDYARFFAIRVDFDARALRERGNLDRRARRRRGGEALGVGRVHGLEVAEVDEVDRRLHHVGEGAAGGFEDGREVVEHAFRLRGDVSADELTGLRIDRDLAAQEYEIAGVDRLRIRADGSRRFEGIHGFHPRQHTTFW